MAELKYVRGRIGFAIFDRGQTHADIAKAMHAEPVSAGFCQIEYAGDLHGMGIKVKCYGESISLGLKSKEEDGNYLENKISEIPY